MMTSIECYFQEKKKKEKKERDLKRISSMIWVGPKSEWLSKNIQSGNSYILVFNWPRQKQNTLYEIL